MNQGKMAKCVMMNRSTLVAKQVLSGLSSHVMTI